MKYVMLHSLESVFKATSFSVDQKHVPALQHFQVFQVLKSFNQNVQEKIL